MFSNFKTDTRSDSRDSKLMDDGRYMYRVWDAAKGCYVKTYIDPKDGVSEEVIQALAEFDDYERKIDRREDDLKDDFYEADLKKEDSYTMFGSMAMNVSDPREEPEQILFPDELDEDPNIIAIRKAIEELTPAQRELIFDLFGLLIPQTEIAQRDRVSKQAVNNRKNKILNRLEDILLETTDLYGVDCTASK